MLRGRMHCFGVLADRQARRKPPVSLGLLRRISISLFYFEPKADCNSEHALAAALRHAGKTNGQAVVATKWSPFFRTAGSIRSTIQQRLRCLAPFAIDLHQVHNPFGFSSNSTNCRARSDERLPKPASGSLLGARPLSLQGWLKTLSFQRLRIMRLSEIMYYPI
jgi:hypothetical protein